MSRRAKIISAIAVVLVIAGVAAFLVLRSAGDANQVPTESVTLQYLLDRFGIELPPKLPYGVTPPIYSLPSAESVAGGTTGQATEQ